MADDVSVRTCLWFDDAAMPAAEFYCSLLPGSRIERVDRYPQGIGMGEPGKVAGVDFTLAGAPYQAINGGDRFQLNEAASITVATEDQAETDRLWVALTAQGGAESQCGWLKDRFGLSWQIVPRRATELMYGPHAARVWAALMRMKKIDVTVLEAAAQGR
ncbi:MAG: VOC family protein [Gammaproteobacteria bacterium]|nr:VOC family protein [Gammaproteobacteria bacterium]